MFKPVQSLKLLVTFAPKRASWSPPLIPFRPGNLHCFSSDKGPKDELPGKTGKPITPDLTGSTKDVKPPSYQQPGVRPTEGKEVKATERKADG